MNKRLWNIVIIAAVAIVAAGSYLIGHAAGNRGESSWLAPAAAAQTSAGWSPTEPYPTREVYFPGTDFRVPTTTGRRAIEPVRDALSRPRGRARNVRANRFMSPIGPKRRGKEWERYSIDETEVHYSIVRPETLGEVWNIRFQNTPDIKSPFSS